MIDRAPITATTPTTEIRKRLLRTPFVGVVLVVAVVVEVAVLVSVVTVPFNVVVLPSLFTGF